MGFRGNKTDDNSATLTSFTEIDLRTDTEVREERKL